MKIYLDNCCYNRPFDTQSQRLVVLETQAKLFIQAGVKQGLYDLVWSFMLESENEENEQTEKRNVIASWGDIANEYCGSSSDILEQGRKYMQFGLKHKDALHLACAIKSGCNYFITTDKKLIRKNDKIDGIEIVNPITFILEMEDSK